MEDLVAGLSPTASPSAGRLLLGIDQGDDAAVLQVEDATSAIVTTTDFFTPVVDDPYDFGSIAATNALSDIYAVGGEPVIALHLLGWPRDVLPLELAREVLRGGSAMVQAAGCHLAGGHSIDDPHPKYGPAVTGLADPRRLLRVDAGEPGIPLTLAKPLGIGVLNTRHKATGEVFPEAVAAMTTLNRDASRRALAAGGSVRHRRHRFRPARPSLQVGQGERRGRRALPGRSARGHP